MKNLALVISCQGNYEQAEEMHRQQWRRGSLERLSGGELLDVKLHRAVHRQ
jgi:hypothetical protein